MCSKFGQLNFDELKALFEMRVAHLRQHVLVDRAVPKDSVSRGFKTRAQNTDRGCERLRDVVAEIMLRMDEFDA